ncbi:YoaK family protein [Mycobacterium sp.]|jgi:uncharacterized membrane protein YoaK (UPF0700 family)|uniref:YoaK family protein n=1 Tax=Mycobacterium sp. TaxID=1785 RepID=UPI002D2F14DA|nr:YoaK family protein [Mycobacterium sp.]HZA12266.1 YoaK family protein [Mycobacterium sp.]
MARRDFGAAATAGAGNCAPSARASRWPVQVAAALTFGTGAIDVATLTHLGGGFASVVTGNLIVMGLGVAHTDPAAVVHATTAVAGFVSGVAIGTRATRSCAGHPSRWPPGVTWVLLAELLVLCGFAIGWFATSAAPTGPAQLGLLATAAVAMGLQTAAIRRVGVPLSTTYLTGAMTGVVAGLAETSRGHWDRAAVASLLAAIGGAITGGIVLSTIPAAMPLLLLAPLGVVVTAAARRHRGVVVAASEPASDRGLLLSGAGLDRR